MVATKPPRIRLRHAWRSVRVGYNYLDEKDFGLTHVILVSGDVELLRGIELQADISYPDLEDQSGDLASVLELSFQSTLQGWIGKAECVFGRCMAQHAFR